MKNLIYTGVMGMLSLTANASEKPFQLHCETSTRMVAGSLHIQVDPGKKYLGYAFEKHHSVDPSQSYQISGSNQPGGGRSKGSSLSITKNEAGDVQILAKGSYFDRATPIGETWIEVLLKKTPYKVLGGYSLGSFLVDGTPHLLEGPSQCTVTVIEEADFASLGSELTDYVSENSLDGACEVPPQNDCSKSPKRLCCDCDASGHLTCS